MRYACWTSDGIIILSLKIDLRYHLAVYLRRARDLFILVTEKGDLEMRDSDNMRAFSIVPEAHSVPVSELTEIGELGADNDRYWLNADVVEELCGQIKDQQWLRHFRAMLESVEPDGYYHRAANRVKAHVEQADA